MGDFDVIVIGGGVAGMCAAKKAKDHGLSVLLLEALYTGGKTVKTENISDYPGFPDGISGEKLTDLLEEAVRSRGVKILHEKVISMDVSGKLKHITTDRDSYTTPSVIIAGGKKKWGFPTKEDFREWAYSILPKRKASACRVKPLRSSETETKR